MTVDKIWQTFNALEMTKEEYLEILWEKWMVKNLGMSKEDLYK